MIRFSNLTLKDRKILFELESNSRQSNKKIARKSRLSKYVVSYRIKKMEKINVIRGYYTVIDGSRLGYVFYRVFLNVIDMPNEKLDEMINYLKDQKSIWWIGIMDGAWNIVFAMWAKNHQEFSKFYDLFNKRFRAYVKEHLVCPLLAYKQIGRTFDLKVKDRAIHITGASNTVQFDKTDLTILKILATNARASLLSIAQELNVDSMTIYHRIKKLENRGIIQGYKIDLNFNTLGLEVYSVKINVRETSRIQSLIEYCSNLPETTAIIQAVGSYDFEFDMEVTNAARYFEIISDIKSKFEFIREIIYYRVLKNYKISYMPEEF